MLTDLLFLLRRNPPQVESAPLGRSHAYVVRRPYVQISGTIQIGMVGTLFGLDVGIAAGLTGWRDDR
jgi:hypothetical protein